MEENEEAKKPQEKAKRELPFDIGALCYSLFLFAAALWPVIVLLVDLAKTGHAGSQMELGVILYFFYHLLLIVATIPVNVYVFFGFRLKLKKPFVFGTLGLLATSVILVVVFYILIFAIP